MNIENNNSIQASTYTIDPAAAIPEESSKRQGESRVNGNPSGKSGSDSIVISSDARAERDKQAIEELERIDRQVQQHEAAHQAAAGEFFRGKSFSYKIGPDGKRYAVAGEVQIDTSAIPSNPQATIAKMQRIRRAAMAPSDPSPQDMSVASEAAKLESDAKAQAQSEAFAGITGDSSASKGNSELSKHSGAALKANSSPETRLAENSVDSKIALAPNLQISILFNRPAILKSPMKPKIDLTL